jgi:hypothetical protein
MQSGGIVEAVEMEGRSQVLMYLSVLLMQLR